MTERAPDDHERPGPSPFLYVYVAGAVLILVAAVLPWLRGPRTLWAWDLSVFWSLVGRVGLLRVPPTMGALALLAGIVLAVPVMLRRPIPVRLALLVGLAILVLAGFTLWRGLSFPRPLGPHVGLVAALLGGGLVSVASVR